jgi:hypothetical protein
LRHLDGTRLDDVGQVPAWFIAGHRKQPRGRPAGRRTGAKDSYKRAPYRKKGVVVTAYLVRAVNLKLPAHAGAPVC